MIELSNIGSAVNYPERTVEDTFSNNGLGEWVFMHFTTPFRVKTPMGAMDRPSGDFLINSPDYPQWHRGIGMCFKNDWFIFNDPEIGKFLGVLNIPINIPFTLTNGEALLSLFSDIQREKILTDRYWKEKIDLLVREIFLEAARGLGHQKDRYFTDREKELIPLFQDARLEIHKASGKSWKVEDMAALVSLSPNRFAVLYRKYFGISPLADLLEFRLNQAKSRLLNHNSKIESIAEECGFTTTHYFWRVFKRRFGLSPSEFRKTVKWHNAESAAFGASGIMP